MPKYTVTLIRPKMVYYQATTEVSADTGEDAAKYAKRAALVWAEAGTDEGPLDVIVDQEHGPSVGWREE